MKVARTTLTSKPVCMDTNTKQALTNFGSWAQSIWSEPNGGGGSSTRVHMSAPSSASSLELVFVTRQSSLSSTIGSCFMLRHLQTLRCPKRSSTPSQFVQAGDPQRRGQLTIVQWAKHGRNTSFR